MSCPAPSLFEQLFAEQLEVEQAAALAAHVEQCERCRAVQEETAVMLRRIQPLDEVQAPSFTEEVMARVKLDRTPTRVAPAATARPLRKWAVRLGAPIAAAATATAVLLLLPRSSDPGAPAEFAARGVERSDPSRWVSLQIYRASEQGYLPVQGTIRSDDPLAFTYLNRSEGLDTLEYLMVFAVDEAGEVYWYYPDRGDGDTRRSSLRVVAAEEAVPLPDQVTQDLEPGQLRLFALFSREPLQAGEVERLAVDAWRQAGTLEAFDHLDLDGVGVDTHLLRVQPGPPGSGR